MDRRRTDFLILGSDEKADDANELHLFERDGADGEEAVNKVHGDKERLGNHAKGAVNTDDPFPKNPSHMRLESLLSVHVLWMRHGFVLTKA